MNILFFSARLGINSNSENSLISLDDSLSSNATDLNKEISSEDSESDSTNLDKDNLIEESPDSASEKNNFQISSSSSNNSTESLDKFFQDPFGNSQKSQTADDCDIYFLDTLLGENKDDSNQGIHTQSNNNPKSNIKENIFIQQSSNSTNCENDSLIEVSIIESNKKNERDKIPKNNNEERFFQSSKSNLENYNIKSDSNDAIKNCLTLDESEMSNVYEGREKDEKDFDARKIEEKPEKKKLFKEISSKEYMLPLYFKSKELINPSNDDSSHTSKNPFKMKDKILNKLKSENQTSENIPTIEKNLKDNISLEFVTSERNNISSECAPTIPTSFSIDKSSTPNLKMLENKTTRDNNTNYEQNTLEYTSAETNSNSTCEFIPKTPPSLFNKKLSTPNQRKSVKRIKKNHLENTPKITKYFKIDKN